MKALLPIATLANLVGKVGSEKSAQLSVWKQGVASCNFTTSVGEVGSFEGLGSETEEDPTSCQFGNWEFAPYFTHQLRKPQVSKLILYTPTG